MKEDRILNCMIALLVGLGVATVLLLIGLTIDLVSGHYITVSGTVIARSYTPSETHTGSGISSNGQMVTTTDTTPERWTVIVMIEGKPIPCKAEPDVWAKCKEDRPVTIRILIGGMTGSKHGHEVID